MGWLRAGEQMEVAFQHSLVHAEVQLIHMSMKRISCGHDCVGCSPT